MRGSHMVLLWYICTSSWTADMAWCALNVKTCRKCHETKATEEFPHKKAHPDGRDDYCKACHAAATAARVAARGPVKEPTVNSKVLIAASHVPTSVLHPK